MVPVGQARAGETRTDLWINAPASIGSTSPPNTGHAPPSVEAWTARINRDRDQRPALVDMAISQRGIAREHLAGHSG